MSRVYTTEQLDWLKTGYPLWLPRELAIYFNAKFAADKTSQQLRSACKNRGIKSGRNPGTGAKDRYQLVTSEQADYLRRMYQEMSLPKLVEAFNEQHGTALMLSQIRSFLKNHGITCGRSGHFGTDGKASWNKGSAGTGLCKPNKGSFQKGSTPGNSGIGV